jgi:hypothetical protein
LKLRILSIYEKGDATKEYVSIEVLQNCTLDYFGVADTTYTDDDKISNKLRHYFWFPRREAAKGERVVLRTGTGKNDQYTTENGTKVHRFYWGLESSVWNDDGDAAVLFQIDTWKTSRT